MMTVAPCSGRLSGPITVPTTLCPLVCAPAGPAIPAKSTGRISQSRKLRRSALYIRIILFGFLGFCFAGSFPAQISCLRRECFRSLFLDAADCLGISALEGVERIDLFPVVLECQTAALRSGGGSRGPVIVERTAVQCAGAVVAAPVVGEPCLLARTRGCVVEIPSAFGRTCVYDVVLSWVGGVFSRFREDREGILARNPVAGGTRVVDRLLMSRGQPLLALRIAPEVVVASGEKPVRRLEEGYGILGTRIKDK